MTRKVFLVNPAQTSFGYSFIAPGWLFRIAGATPTNLVGDPVIVDETIKRFDTNNIKAGDIVGIGITTGNCLRGYEILTQAKSRGATVVMGGIHATILPEEALHKGADAVVTGNGDLIWKKVVIDIFNKHLKRKYDGGQVPGEMMAEARLDLLDPRKYMFASVQTVAGCPENCSFCSVWVTDGRKPRQRLTDKIIAEVKQLKSMGFNFIIFADDNFNPSTLGRIERVHKEGGPMAAKKFEKIREERLQFFREYHEAIPDAPYAFTQATSEVVSDPEYLKAMYEEMRIRAVLIGIESFTADGLKDVNKTWNPVGVEMTKVIQTIQENGIAVLSSIIGGLESDTVETLRTMRKFALDSGTLMAQFTNLSPYLGTKDFHEYEKDRKVREGILHIDGYKPKHKNQFLYPEYWLDHNRPQILIKHPVLSAEQLIKETDDNWRTFYSLKNVIQRAKTQPWPLSGKIWYGLGSLAFNALYHGHGASADSVKKDELSFAPRLLIKMAVRFYNRFFRKPVSLVKSQAAF